MLGIIIGVASVIAMLAIGEGSKAEYQERDVEHGNQYGNGNAQYAATWWRKPWSIKFNGFEIQ